MWNLFDPINTQQFSAITLKVPPKEIGCFIGQLFLFSHVVQILSQVVSNTEVKKDQARTVGVLVEECLLVSVIRRQNPSNATNSSGERKCADLTFASSITSFKRSRVRILHGNARNNICLEGEVFETKFIVQGFNSPPTALHSVKNLCLFFNR